MKKETLKYQDNGRSMAENVGVIGLIAFLLLVSIFCIDRVNEILRINSLRNEIAAMVSLIRAFPLKNNDYKSLSAQTLIAGGQIPKTILVEKNNMLNTYKGTILAGTAHIPHYKDSAFILIYNGLDAKACRAVTTISWDGDYATGFLGISIRNDGDLTPYTSGLQPAEFKTDHWTMKPEKLPIDEILDEQSYLCDCGEQKTCSVAWKFL